MKQIVVISGKGGTGKTTVSASLCFLLPNLIAADCDVDAANLHLMMSYRVKEKQDYLGGKKALITEEKCTGCGKCRSVCRFDAVRSDHGLFHIDTMVCEGCGACLLVCPSGAVVLERNISGNVVYSETERFQFTGGELFPGEATSGGLVSQVKQLAINKAEKTKNDLLLADGAPGIACPAISSLSGADYAVIVTEPSVSAFHDLKRTIVLVRKFKVSFGVIVNKQDISPETTAEIEKYCLESGIPLLGIIPFDHTAVEAARNGRPVIDYPYSPAAKAILKIKDLIEKIVFENKGEKA